MESLKTIDRQQVLGRDLTLLYNELQVLLKKTIWGESVGQRVDEICNLPS